MLDFDVETRGLQWFRPEHGVFMVQFRTPNGDTFVFDPGKAEDRERIQEMLDKAPEYGGLRAWNSCFDFHHIEQAGFTLPPEEYWHDGMVAAHILDERGSVALKAQAEKHLGEAAREPEEAVRDWIMAERRARRKKAKETGGEYVPPTYADVPYEIMEEYGVADVVLTAALGELHDKQFEENPDLLKLYELERKVMAAKFHMEKRGVPISREDALALEAEVLADLEKASERLVELSGSSSFNPRSPAQVAAALEDRGADLTYALRTSTGKISTSSDSLANVDDELADAILEYRAASKMYDAYLRPMLHSSDSDYGKTYPLLGTDDRIRPDYRQVGARTGRFSAGTPNMQNWHRDDLRLRYLVKARPGHKLICCDLDSIELKVFSAYCGEGSLRDSLLSGADPHEATADAAGLTGRTRSDGSFESARQQGKTLNYLLIYGGGVGAVMRAFHVDRDEALRILDNYHHAFPEVRAFMDNIKYRLDERGYVTTVLGRRQRKQRLWDPDRKKWYTPYYAYVNYLIQGTSADIMKGAMVKIHEEGIPMILTVHDEIVAEVPEEQAEEAAAIIQQALTGNEEINELVPLSAEAQIVDRWSEAKDPSWKPSWAE